MLEIILDFKKNIGKYIFLVFEKIILLLFLVILLSDILKIHDGLERLKGIDQNNIYINHDMTSDEKIDQLFSNEKESIIKCKELYHFISNNFKKYSFYSYSTDLVVNDNEILLTSTDKYFFDIYSIKVENGRNFNLSDYKNTNTIIPVIIGYNVSNKYKLNDNFRIIDPNTNLKKEFKVIGVLNKNSNYTNFDVIGQKNSLDDMIIKIIDEKDLNSLATLDMSLSNMIIFSNNEKEINKISDMSLKLDLFNMKFDKLQDTTNEYLDFVKEGLLINGTIFILSVLFVVFTTTVCINRIIKSSINKYIIYYYCGASLKNIIINININLLLLELISLLVPIIYCLSFNINLFIVFVLLVISLLINLFSSMIIYFNLRKNNLISLYRLEK